MPTQEQILDALKTVRFPGLSRDIVSFGFVRNLQVDGGKVSFSIHFQTENPNVGAQLAKDAEPAQQMMLGITGRPQIDETDEKIMPMENYGIKTMSLGLITDPDTPVIWRGPMVMKALDQFLSDVKWGELDFMIIDLPPGTGDAQLTLTQKVPLTGAVVVTTPQDVALIDARKGLAMFRKVNVPVLGIVENMSYFICRHCGEREEIFGHGGGKKTAEMLGVPFLGEVPLDPKVVVGGDSGAPIVVLDPQSAAARAFEEVAAHVLAQIESGTEGHTHGPHEHAHAH
jgi:ATP-binding protein involved in chromosome partitioning